MKKDKQILENLYTVITEAQVPVPGYAKARERAADDMAHYGDGTPESNPGAHQRLKTGVNPQLYKLLLHPEGSGGEATVTITGKHVAVQFAGDGQVHFKNRAALTPEELREVMRFIQTNKVVQAAFSAHEE